MNNIQTIIILFSVACLVHTANAQTQEDNDKIILSAMKDELHNNMENLREDGFDKPFFMGYTVTDMKIRLSSAAYGAQILYKELENRDWNTRVMVGNYDINDENFDDSFEGANNDVFYENVPIDADYLGLRRVLWAGTNNVFKQAARLYKQKLKAIEDYDIDYKLPDFSKEPPSEYIEKPTLQLASKEILETLVVDISEYIDQVDSVYVNTAVVSDLTGRRYYYNSEGTTTITNHQVSQIAITLSMIDSEGYINTVNLNYAGKGVDDFPDMQHIRNDIDWHLRRIRNKANIAELEDDYNGPIMLEGKAVAVFLMSKILRSGNGILPSRSAFSNKNEQSVERFFEELEKDMTEDDDYKIDNKQMIVTSLPSLSVFEGKELIGSYEIDAEGVKPVEELVLIRDGMVVQKLNGRIPAPGALRSTGSNRPLLSPGGMNKTIAPGVLKVDFKDKMSSQELLAKFDDAIADNDEKTGMIVHGSELLELRSPLGFKIYNRETGNRTPVRKANFSYSGKNQLKKIIAVSDDYYVYNLRYSGNAYGNSGSGVPMSIIVPKTIVIRDMDISKSTYKGKKPDLIVPIPGSSE